MTSARPKVTDIWKAVSFRFLPFADAATKDLPLPRLLRLALFQISVGMAMVLLNATLNRVMIVELGVSAGLVSVMIALPLLFAPARVLIGHRSDQHKSFLGWKRVPYIWIGTLLQFGGFAIMPFSLLLLTGEGVAENGVLLGQVGGALAFLLVGAGLHTTQTAGLALATDLAPEDKRPRVVALLYVMLLIGMVASSIVLGRLLSDFTYLALIQVVQGAAVVTVVLNVIALWKQEARNRQATRHDRERTSFTQAWIDFVKTGRPGRLLVATGLGAAAFSMQDILLEPYGGEVLGLSVGATTALTALLAGGTLVGFALASRWLSQGMDTARLAAFGAMIGLVAFPLVILSDTFGSAGVFRIGTALIGLGSGLFSVGTLTAAMALADAGNGRTNGIALGAWGAVQASAIGLAVAFGGFLRDGVTMLAKAGALGPALAGPSAGYVVVYTIEIVLIFATLAAIGPMVRHVTEQKSQRFGLAEFPS